MTTDRLGKTFDHLRGKNKLGIIPFLTVGYPDIETTLEIVPALEKAGASIFELGVPFSDPLADGPTIPKSKSSRSSARGELITLFGYMR